ncbi:MAG TPA: DUF3891 family protein [Terriglobales bacterium]|nr:DUF3891 family protein [Terriglobales bacterium]
MILRPLDQDGGYIENAQTAQVARMAATFRTDDNMVPAWMVVAQTQGANASRYLLVGQPDHALLAGQLAAAFEAGFLPEITEQVSQGIAVHDNGWAQFPFERDLAMEPPVDANGRPKSFLQVTVHDSLSAWRESIEAGREVGPLAEYMVSGHFYRLGKVRLQMKVDSPEDTEHVQQFVHEEENRQKKLASKTSLSHEELDRYVDLLQFCDTLSLYLCCGSTAATEFPQEFGGRKLRIRHEDGVYVTEPSVFGGVPHRFSIPVRVYPSNEGEGRTRIGFHIK